MRYSSAPDAAIQALYKLDAGSGERRNLTDYLKACYGGRIRFYDREAALRSLNKLTVEEQHALIACALLKQQRVRLS